MNPNGTLTVISWLRIEPAWRGAATASSRTNPVRVLMILVVIIFSFKKFGGPTSPRWPVFYGNQIPLNPRRLPSRALVAHTGQVIEYRATSSLQSSVINSRLKAGRDVDVMEKPGPIARFDGFDADFRTQEIRKQGVRVKLPQQSFQILQMLLERPGELVSRDELRQALWPGDTFVDFDHGVNNSIKRIRDALGDSADSPRYIETLPRLGYRFVAPVETQNLADSGTTVLGSETSSSGQIRTKATGAPRSYGIRAKVLASAVVAAIALLVIISMTSVREPWLGHRSPPRIQSLAVLPLVNLSSDAGQDYFTDGMTEELTTDLGKISALRVISRTSAMQYKGTKKSLPEG